MERASSDLEGTMKGFYVGGLSDLEGKVKVVFVGGLNKRNEALRDALVFFSFLDGPQSEGLARNSIKLDLVRLRGHACSDAEDER
jgi:hypothetical protein